MSILKTRWLNCYHSSIIKHYFPKTTKASRWIIDKFLWNTFFHRDTWSTPFLFPPIIPHRIYAHFRGDPASMYFPEIERTTCTRPENIFILENIFIVETSQPTSENHCRRSRMVHAPRACLQSESSKFQAPRRHLVSSSDSSSSVDARCRRIAGVLADIR